MQLDFYDLIIINQIGADLDELILSTGSKKVNINIRYATNELYDNKSISEKNSIRLDIIHTALTRLAVQDKRIDISKLEAIKNRILESNFSFEIVLKEFANPRKNDLTAKIIIQPLEYQFNFFVVIEENGQEKCRLLIYVGKTTDHYFPLFFKFGRWTEDREFIITGKEKEVEFHILIDKCEMKLVNLTKFEKPPLHELMRADISPSDKERAYQDWLHSLPPGAAGMTSNDMH